MEELLRNKLASMSFKMTMVYETAEMANKLNARKNELIDLSDVEKEGHQAVIDSMARELLMITESISRDLLDIADIVAGTLRLPTEEEIPQ